MPGGDLAARWEKAKTDFEKMTGKSKPKASSKLGKAFHHTGVSGVLKKCDKFIVAIETENKNMKKKAKFVAAGAKYVPTASKACKNYMTTLDKAISDEVTEKNTKTTYYKALKFLKARLDSLEKKFEQVVNSNGAVLDENATVFEKSVRMLRKSTRAAIANAIAGVKKIKADPTPATFNEIFKTNNNVARQVQVQLVNAAAAQKKDMLGQSNRIDPRHIANMLTPWQAGGKNQAVIDDMASAQDVLGRLDDFTRMLKLARAFADDLEQMA